MQHGIREDLREIGADIGGGSPGKHFFQQGDPRKSSVYVRQAGARFISRRKARGVWIGAKKMIKV